MPLRAHRILRYLLIIMALTACAPNPPSARAAELVIAAAADLTFVFPEVAARFEQATGRKAKLSFGSSGNFYSQIQNGAPFDLFFSADINYPKMLESAGLAEPGSLYEYAVGKIVVWAPQHSDLDIQRGLAALQDPKVRHIAVANPAHAPYGRAAIAALEHENIYASVQAKLVLGENVSQTAQFVQSGSADVGIVALSLALAPAMKDKGRYFLIPASSYPPIEQGAVILKSSKNKLAAQQFVNFLKQPEIVELMRRYGFEAAPAQAK